MEMTIKLDHSVVIDTVLKELHNSWSYLNNELNRLTSDDGAPEGIFSFDEDEELANLNRVLDALETVLEYYGQPVEPT